MCLISCLYSAISRSVASGTFSISCAWYSISCLFFVQLSGVFRLVIREVKQTATTTATRTLYISLPFFAKQEREMTKFCFVHGTWTTKANFSYFHLELNAIVAYLA